MDKRRRGFLRKTMALAVATALPLPVFRDNPCAEIAEQYFDMRWARASGFYFMGTVTGRFSCSQPNYSNTPQHSDAAREIRQAFTSKDGVVDKSEMYKWLYNYDA